MPAEHRRWALLSASDKTGLADLGRALADSGFGLLSTGGSAQTLTEAGLPVTEVSEYTGFPEIMGGRVKTLNPKVHGGILARRGLDDAVMAEHAIERIDIVVVNLYPFSATVARPGCALDQAIEQIDIGGPAMLRAAAKNHEHVTVVCDPADYAGLAETLPEGPGPDQRRELAIKAFAHTAAYDGQISQWLSQQAVADQKSLPPVINLSLDLERKLRYGENPHQAAGLYRNRGEAPTGLAGCRPLQGKALSYNNLLDADAAWKGAHAFGQSPACVIVKHTNPCGAAIDSTAGAAFERALACDPTSAFGGIIAVNAQVDGALARAMLKRFTEVLIAPELTDEAREVFAAKPNVRVLTPEPPIAGNIELRAIDGGWLVQHADEVSVVEQDLKVVTERAPTEQEMADMCFAWAAVALVRSNAIVYASGGATVGIGAGQMSRIDSARFAALKAADAGLTLEGAVMASDAFFPFADSIETAAERGIRAVIQPGGSMRDEEVIEACNRHDMAMVFTGRRHFRH